MKNLVFELYISFLDRMNFSFKSTGAKKLGTKAVNPFANQDQEPEIPQPNQLKPLHYLKIRTEMVKSTLAGDEEAEVSLEERTRDELVAAKKRRELLGLSSSSSSQPVSEKFTGESTANLKQAGLVILDASKDFSVKAESKHIARMVETAEVNDKFKNLLKMKTAQREKDKAESEFGARPEEFITTAYLKQKQESLRLEKELEARESSEKKRDIANMFKEMLDSGSYARTHYADSTKQAGTGESVSKDILSKIVKSAEATVAPTAEQVQKVLSKVLPESSAEVTKIIHEKAKEEALKIIQQIDQLGVDEDEDHASRGESRMSAKERYLQRKRRKIIEEAEDIDS